MPTLRRILLALVLGTVCAGPALADIDVPDRAAFLEGGKGALADNGNGDGTSTQFSGTNFKGTARFIDSERMSIVLDENRYAGRGESTPSLLRHSRIVYNLRTGRAVVSRDEGTDPKTATIDRYEVVLRDKLTPKQVVSWLNRDGLERNYIQTLARPRAAVLSWSGFVSKMKSILKR